MENNELDQSLRQRYAMSWERAESFKTLATIIYVTGFCIAGISFLLISAVGGNHLQEQMLGAVAAPLGILGGLMLAVLGFIMHLLSGILMAVTDTAYIESKKYHEGRGG